jgi:hypothetical protein
MAHAPHHAPVPVAEKYDSKKLGNLPTICLGAGAVGILGSLIGLFVNKAQFAHSWLFAFAYFFTIAVGCLFWICLHHATDAEWSVVVRRVWENIASLLPWFALLFLPLILLCQSDLWHWWNKPPGADPLLDHKHGYLSHGFFWFRAIGYFVLLTIWSLGLRGRSVTQDTDASSVLRESLFWLSA